LKGTSENLLNRSQSGTSIYKSAKYFRDLGNYLDTTLLQFFDFVKNIPYLEDKPGTEITARPKYLIQKRYNFKGLDCKKKATLMGAWFNAHNIPWRLVAVSERADKEIHHVFTQALINGAYENVDPTYPEFKLFEPKKNVTRAEILL